jgi:hypothetical protein
MLKDCTMMKNFVTSEALSLGGKPKGDLGGKDMAPIPVEAVVTTIFGLPCPGPGDAT